MSVRLSDLEHEGMLRLFKRHRLKKENVSDSLRLLLVKMQFVPVGVINHEEAKVLELSADQLECARSYDYESWEAMMEDPDYPQTPYVFRLLRSEE